MEPVSASAFRISDRIEKGGSLPYAILVLGNHSPIKIASVVVRFKRINTRGEVEAKSEAVTRSIDPGEVRQIFRESVFERHIEIEDILVTLEDGSTIALQDYRKKLGGGGCFIATAIYRDEDHPVLADLRQFRDQVLLRFPVGRRAVEGYYRVGPGLASRLKHSPGMRASTALVVIPVCRTISWGVRLCRVLKHRLFLWTNRT